MKKRFGFVSNSSSSSFIVAFQPVPKNINELKAILKHWSNDVVKQVWHDIIGQLSGNVIPEEGFITELTSYHFFSVSDNTLYNICFL